MAWERVYSVNNFWDRPRLGVADVFAIANIYETPLNESNDDYEDFLD